MNENEDSITVQVSLICFPWLLFFLLLTVLFAISVLITIFIEGQGAEIQIVIVISQLLYLFFF